MWWTFKSSYWRSTRAKISKKKLKIYCSSRQGELWNQRFIASMEKSYNNRKKKKDKVKNKANKRRSSRKRRLISFQLFTSPLDFNSILISHRPWGEWPISSCIKLLPKLSQESQWLKSLPNRYKRSTMEGGALKDWRKTWTKSTYAWWYTIPRSPLNARALFPHLVYRASQFSFLSSILKNRCFGKASSTSTVSRE